MRDEQNTLKHDEHVNCLD